MEKGMTELQLKIRRLAHRVSALKKAGKDVSAVVAELTKLRAMRKEELAASKGAAKPAGEPEKAPEQA